MEPRRTTALVALVLLVVLLLTWLLWPRGDSERAAPPSVGPEPIESPDAPEEATTRSPSAREVAPRSEPATLSAATRREAVVGALDALPLPDGFRLRCPTDLSDGLYEAIPVEGASKVRFVTVRQGELFAAAWSDAGEVWVTQDLLRVARLRWDAATEGWSSCSVEPSQVVDVTGVVHFGADAAAGLHTVIGCQSGEVAEVEEDGAFSLQAVVGTVCHLIVLVELGESFGRSETVSLKVQGPIEGVELSGPARDSLWSPARQIQVAAQLAGVGDAMLEARRADPRPELQVDLEGAEGVVARAWAQQEDQHLINMVQQLDDLEDPTYAKEYLRAVFMGFY